MKMFSKFKSLSRTVHEEQEQEPMEQTTYPRIRNEGKSLCCTTSLTVWRKSLLISCNGFTVIDSNGNLVYRVDNYMGRTDQITLMDASGKSILTMCRRRKLGLLVSWFMYEGEMGNKSRRRSTSSESESPICCVRKHFNILKGGNVQACVYRTDKRRCAAFVVEGSYANRTCKVMDESRRVVAEIKKKEADTKHVSFGVDIFQLIVYPDFDPGFAMALVLLLDQMFE